MNSNPLPPIWEAYLVVTEGLMVSKRVVSFSLNATETLNALDDSETEAIKQMALGAVVLRRR